MSTGSAIHQYDTGTTFQVTVTDDGVPAVAIDLSTATLLAFCFERPDGSVFDRTPSFVGTGADGQLQYTTVLADLDQPGQWKLQVRYVLASGVDRRADVQNFNVKANVCT